ncbi:MAG: hypothetical protein DRI89_08615 [Bacteroidetes bacterium]|nr:MAG: hypothetical protein DRI89_08615 [Bacteroidota bacterium]
MKIINIKKIILSLVFAFAVSFTFAQITEPGDPPGGGPGGGDPPVGGSAPIGGGLVIMLASAAVYGGKKVYSLMKENKEELES